MNNTVTVSIAAIGTICTYAPQNTDDLWLLATAGRGYVDLLRGETPEESNITIEQARRLFELTTQALADRDAWADQGEHHQAETRANIVALRRACQQAIFSDDPEQCAHCGEIARERTCSHCAVSARILDCGDEIQPRPIAARRIDGSELHHDFCWACARMLPPPAADDTDLPQMW